MLSNSKGPAGQIQVFFSSVRLTVVLLLLLAGTSILGTVIPQNEAPIRYIQTYGEFVYRFLNVFDLFDMYRSWWFRLLIILLSTNILVCTMGKIPATRKMLSRKKPDFTPPSSGESFTDPRNASKLVPLYKDLVAKKFAACSENEDPDGISLYAEKGRWTRLAFYGIHLSILILLAGALMGSMFGHDGYVKIPEGGSVSRIGLRNNGGSLPLGFEVRCNNFSVSYYKSGSPKEYRSSLTILENGKEVETRDIIVNSPLKYKGFTFYQSSYGNLPSNELIFAITNAKSGKTTKVETKIGETIPYPGDENKGKAIKLTKKVASYEFRGRNLGETVMAQILEDGKEAVDVAMPIRFPTFDRMRKGELVLSVPDFKHKYYTGLQVTKDPGVPLVYTGFILLLSGCFMAFFINHRKLKIRIEREGSGSRITVAGKTNRNKPGMKRKVKLLARELAMLQVSGSETGGRQ